MRARPHDLSAARAGYRPGPRAVHVRRLRAAVRRILDLDDETAVLIRQRGHPTPAGAGVETLVALIAPGQPVYRWRMPRPVDEVSPEDLAQLFLRAPADAPAARPAVAGR